jgi:lipopolysaccharide transport system ATP-binding protein
MSNHVVIRVERLGKRYSLSHLRDQRYIALRDVLVEKATGLFRRNGRNKTTRQRDNETTGQGDAGELVSGRRSGPVVSSPVVSGPSTEDFWALREISFEVLRGEVVGIIGRNGAGKSTLLKILSRITDPTEGRVHIKGRVASLLEVGTGFHPELTGRENIFLNGAILGMTRAEITKKFDEIVAFAEVEKFLDTPVKRYSSGMYVRLAFAVAAHLEPEILVIDEVLAVGDAEFQKKCLGKMESVAKGEGRTVLFVSHNMAAVRSLTAKTLVLDAGRLIRASATQDAIDHYVNVVTKARNGSTQVWGRGKHTAIKAVRLLDESGAETTSRLSGAPLIFEIDFATDGSPRMSIELFLQDANRLNLALASLHQFHGKTLPTRPGTYRTRLKVQPPTLASGTYNIVAATSVVNSHWDHRVEEAVAFEIPFANPESRSWDFRQSLGYGACALPCSEPPEFSELSQ